MFNEVCLLSPYALFRGSGLTTTRTVVRVQGCAAVLIIDIVATVSPREVELPTPRPTLTMADSPTDACAGNDNMNVGRICMGRLERRTSACRSRRLNRVGRSESLRNALRNFFCSNRDGRLIGDRVRKGDIIIVASDGLADNLFDDDILEEVQRFAPPQSKTQNKSASSERDDEQDHNDWANHDDLPPDLRRDSGIDLASMANGFGPEPNRPSMPDRQQDADRRRRAPRVHQARRQHGH